MHSVRLIPVAECSIVTACCRCGLEGGPWDRLAGKAYCPNCEEQLVRGESPPLVEPTEKRHCAICQQAGTLRYLTFPLDRPVAAELDLCGRHLRGLLGRCLGAHAFHQIRRLLEACDLSVEEIFLLHAAFYDPRGNAICPALPD
jgi:hypothetical protein